MNHEERCWEGQVEMLLEVSGSIRRRDRLADNLDSFWIPSASIREMTPSSEPETCQPREQVAGDR